MNESDRGIDPGEAFSALQRFIGGEFIRYSTEISVRDAYINKLEQKISELEEKLRGE